MVVKALFQTVVNAGRLVVDVQQDLPGMPPGRSGADGPGEILSAGLPGDFQPPFYCLSFGRMWFSPGQEH